MIETGVRKRIYERQHTMLYRNEFFEMQEPHPLGVNNVLFLFNSLGIGMLIAVGFTIVEWVVAIWKKTSEQRPDLAAAAIRGGKILKDSW